MVIFGGKELKLQRNWTWIEIEKGGPDFFKFHFMLFLALRCWLECTNSLYSPKGGGGALPYNKSYRYVPPQRVWFSRRFAHFVLNLGIVFEGTTGPFVIGAFEKRVPGLKMGVENDMFYGLKQGQGLKNRAAHPHQEFLGVPRRGLKHKKIIHTGDAFFLLIISPPYTVR